MCREPRRAVGASPGFFITVVSPAAVREPVRSVLEDAICCARTRPRDSHLGDLGSPHPLSGGMAGVRSRWTDRGCWAVAGMTAGSFRTHRSAGGRLLCGRAKQPHGCFPSLPPMHFPGELAPSSQRKFLPGGRCGFGWDSMESTGMNHPHSLGPGPGSGRPGWSAVSEVGSFQSGLCP